MPTVPPVRINDFSYELPEERIAVYPLPERDQSRLLLWKDGNISETLFADAGREIPEKSLLVFNNTRVIHARLIFFTEAGARIEIFCLEPHQPADYQLSFQSTGTVEWKCLVGNSRKWKRGALVMSVPVGVALVTLQAERTVRLGNAFGIRFTWDHPVTFATLIDAAGSMPIPPYLHRPAETIDDDRYQTSYARINGSVAAPTAGLHFTPRIMDRLKDINISFAEITLHVGAGTFQPVKSDLIADHDMHTETVYFTKAFLDHLLHYKGRVIAVGTTSVRSLESLYWLGAGLSDTPAGFSLHVDQWRPYTHNTDIPPSAAIANLLEWMEIRQTGQISFTTSIIIIPGYRFRMIRGMFTNFHQPHSTLLLLVAAFLGPDWKKVYDYALNHGFRFLSYGDANLYLKS